MKFLFALALACSALVLGGCADQSLITDEEYAEMRKPAANSPDPMQHLPYNPNVQQPHGY
jgi:PBP1b-binding outer membrane lipoprotein LpoB